jgi:hypothetical protein
MRHYHKMDVLRSCSELDTIMMGWTHTDQMFEVRHGSTFCDLASRSKYASLLQATVMSLVVVNDTLTGRSLARSISVLSLMVGWIGGVSLEIRIIDRACR